MPARPLLASRSALLLPEELKRVEETAIRLLSDVGIEIAHPEVSRRAQARGFSQSGGRVRLQPGRVETFLNQARGGTRKPRRAPSPRQARPRRQLILHVDAYPQELLHPETKELVPFTTEHLTWATRLVGALRERGVAPQVPGYPMDVPAELRPLQQFRIGAENTLGPWVQDPITPESFPYVMDMAEVLGWPIRAIPVWVVSPLKLGGETLDLAVQLEDRLDLVEVGSMPAAGGTAAVRPSEALAVSLAEVIGSALILQACVRTRVDWRIRADPFDLRGLSLVYGSPESALFQMASHEVDAYVHGVPWQPGLGNIHTLAKEPGPQAAAEKMSILTLGGLWRTREFWGAGSLSLEEVFSPVQLMVDLELRDHVERLIAGMDPVCDAEATVVDVQAGLSGGFISLDRTLDSHEDLYWHSRLFERRYLSSWLNAGSPSFDRQAWHLAKELARNYEYELPINVKTEIGRIYQTAARELAAV